jgi:hypothetical protein
MKPIPIYVLKTKLNTTEIFIHEDRTLFSKQVFQINAEYDTA